MEKICYKIWLQLEQINSKVSNLIIRWEESKKYDWTQDRNLEVSGVFSAGLFELLLLPLIWGLDATWCWMYGGWWGPLVATSSGSAEWHGRPIMAPSSWEQSAQKSRVQSASCLTAGGGGGRAPGPIQAGKAFSCKHKKINLNLSIFACHFFPKISAQIIIKHCIVYFNYQSTW